jgi:hypothetical protein
MQQNLSATHPLSCKQRTARFESTAALRLGQRSAEGDPRQKQAQRRAQAEGSAITNVHDGAPTKDNDKHPHTEGQSKEGRVQSSDRENANSSQAHLMLSTQHAGTHDMRPLHHREAVCKRQRCQAQGEAQHRSAQT